MVSSKSCFIVIHALKRFETHNLRLLIRRSLFDQPIVSTLAPVVFLVYSPIAQPTQLSISRRLVYKVLMVEIFIFDNCTYSFWLKPYP